MSSERGRRIAEGSLGDHHHHTLLQPTTPSRYESKKRRDWNTFGRYLKSQSPPIPLSQCNYNHVLDFLSYLGQFGKTKVHLQGSMFYGQPELPAPSTYPFQPAWGRVDALIGRLHAAYEENVGSPVTNPFASHAIQIHSRWLGYEKKKKPTPGKENDESSSTMHFS